eukprot:TRINITY_DN2995_c0_g1_i1.p1 TRINITY_DN2995_c0_g1~~TRINITY_DN2995_c0_g1_i1.p1  ORF type:complete len:637 (-),score=204.60 TRINITY_DN2995_c0_g1_i1:143-1915(-)
MMDRGELEIMHASSFTTGSSWGRGIDLQIMTAVTPNDDLFQFWVKNTPAINTPADLQGRIFATVGNSVLHYLAVEFLNAFSLTNVTLWTNMTTSNFARMWPLVDGMIFANIPFFSQYGGRSLMSASMLGTWRKGYAFTLSVRRDFGLQHPEAITKVVDSMLLLGNGFMDFVAGTANQSMWGLNGTLLPTLLQYTYGYVNATSYAQLKAFGVANPREIFPTTLLPYLQKDGIYSSLMAAYMDFNFRTKNFIKPVALADERPYLNRTYFDLAVASNRTLNDFPALQSWTPLPVVPPFVCPNITNATFTAPVALDVRPRVTSTLNCKWIINIPEGAEGLILHFKYLFIQSQDFFVVETTRPSSSSPTLLASLVGEFKPSISNLPPPISVLGSNLTLRVSFDTIFANPVGLPPEQGFVVEVLPITSSSDKCLNGCGNGGKCLPSGECLCPPAKYGADCSGSFCMGTKTMSDDEGVISHGSGNYKSFADCRWTISPSLTSSSPSSSGEKGIVMTLNSFDLETGFDFLRIYQGSSFNSSNLILSFPFASAGMVISTGLPSVSLQLKTDGYITRSGFNISYSLAPFTNCSSALFPHL